MNLIWCDLFFGGGSRPVPPPQNKSGFTLKTPRKIHKWAADFMKKDENELVSQIQIFEFLMKFLKNNQESMDYAERPNKPSMSFRIRGDAKILFIHLKEMYLLENGDLDNSLLNEKYIEPIHVFRYVKYFFIDTNIKISKKICINLKSSIFDFYNFWKFKKEINLPYDLLEYVIPLFIY